MKNDISFVRGFWIMSCQDRFNPTMLPTDMTEAIHIEKRHSHGGVKYEFQISWYKYPSGNAARLEMFGDSFEALNDNREFFALLSHIKNPTPDDVHKLLVNLGYVDFSYSKRKPNNNTGICTYICYVQNYLGIMDGEGVVSNMAVFTNQNDIDNWLREQLDEATSDGYMPEDDPKQYFGTDEFELSVSKGSEKDGYTSYGIVCKPYYMNI